MYPSLPTILWLIPIMDQWIFDHLQQLKICLLTYIVRYCEWLP